MAVPVTFTNHLIMLTKSKTKRLINDRKSTSADPNLLMVKPKTFLTMLPSSVATFLGLKKKHRMELKQLIQGPKTAFMVVISDIIS